MPEVEVNVEVYCSCGEGLCNQTESKRTRMRQEPCFIVEPCKRCLEREYDRGVSDGKDESDKEHALG